MNRISNEKYCLLKWIAIFTMLTDHIACVLNEPCGFSEETYLAMRFIGRLAMPLFCFLLVESYRFTQNKLRHLLKIAVLAIISEIPYNLCRCGSIIAPEEQNVCFTLGLGFLCLWITNLNADKILYLFKRKKFGKVVCGSFRISMTGICMLIAYLMQSDTSWKGIMLIALLDSARRHKHTKIRQFTAIGLFIASFGTIANLMCLLDLLLIYWTCSQKECNKPLLTKISENKACRMISRYFYPVHLAILYAVKRILTNM